MILCLPSGKAGQCWDVLYQFCVCLIWSDNSFLLQYTENLPVPAARSACYAEDIFSESTTKRCNLASSLRWRYRIFQGSGSMSIKLWASSKSSTSTERLPKKQMCPTTSSWLTHLFPMNIKYMQQESKQWIMNFFSSDHYYESMFTILSKLVP